MYLHLGKGSIVNDSEIVGIFDLDITSQSHLTRKYLSLAEKAGQVETACDDLPKSFVVCDVKQTCRRHVCSGGRSSYAARSHVGQRRRIATPVTSVTGSQ